MFRKSLLSAALGVLLTVGAASAAEVVVRVGPPAPVVETRVVSPGPGYVWTPGYHRWDGNRYVWTAGAWVQPPRPHAHWVAHRWVRRNGGWVMVEGHWR
jgi:WXXGXW repeat (2 copies)